VFEDSGTDLCPGIGAGRDHLMIVSDLQVKSVLLSFILPHGPFLMESLRLIRVIYLSRR